MPDQEVEFVIISRGIISIPAGSQRDAALIVERLDSAVLEKHTSSVEVIAGPVDISRS